MNLQPTEPCGGQDGSSEYCLDVTVDDGRPPEEVLLELGRLVWVAINLEGDVQFVGRCVRPRGGPFDDMEAARRIGLALDDLRDRPLDDGPGTGILGRSIRASAKLSRWTQTS